MLDSTRKFLKDRFCFIAYLFIMFLLVFLLGGITIPPGGGNVYLVITVLEIVIFVLPSLLYLRTVSFDYTKELYILPPEIGKIPTVFGMLLMMISVNILLGFIIPSIDGNTYEPTHFTTGGDISAVGVIISLAVVPAICEEFAFRAVIMSESNKTGAFFSILLSSLLFAMIHFNKSGFIAYFMNGILLALTVYITRSVVASMLVHALYNVYSLFIEGRIWLAISKNVNITMVIFFFLAMFLVGALIVLYQGAKHFSDYYLLGISPPAGYSGIREDDYAFMEHESVSASGLPVIDFLACTIPCIILYIIISIIGG